MEKKSKFYKKWWFWVIVLLILAIGTTLIIVSIKNDTVEISSSPKTKTTTTRDSYNSKIRLKENPYEVSNKYDGVYKFSLISEEKLSDTTIYKGEGYISFNNGKCNIKETINVASTNDVDSKNYNIVYSGFCGLNLEDNSNFYFTINYDRNCQLVSYKCLESDKDLICELKSYRDLVEGTSKELKLTFMSEAKDIDSAIVEEQNKEKARKEEEERLRKEQEEKDFKASCKAYTFEQMARNPDNFKGNNVKITGEVIQALYDSTSVDLRVNITKQGKYSTYYTDTVYVVYYPQVGEDKILENDIITVYGTAQGDYSYKSTIGSKVTLPLIYGKYVEIQ